MKRRCRNIVGKTKIVTLVTLVAIVAVITTLVLTVSANDGDTLAMDETENVARPFRHGQMCWMNELNEDQKAELEAMREEMQDAIQAKLDEWDIEMERGSLANLTEEQRTELQTIIQKYKDAKRAKLEEWDVDLPEFNGPNGWLSNLTDEQLDELRIMREEFRGAVQAKLDEWGIETPEFHNQMDFGRFGPMRRGLKGFGFRGLPMP